MNAEERRQLDVRVSAWRLSQFLHGEQGALLVCGQLINTLPSLDAKLYAAMQCADESRHVEAFQRYVTRLHKVYPVDPFLKKIIDQILVSDMWELKLVGMQMIVEGLALASFQVMRRQIEEPLLRQLFDYVLQDEGRHVNFGLYYLKQAIPSMEATKREFLEDFAWEACSALFAGFHSSRAVWHECGWDAEEIEHDIALNSKAIRDFGRQLFAQNLVPRLHRIGLISERVLGRYQRAGLLRDLTAQT